MPKVRDMLSTKSKERLYRLTKNIIEMQKDISITDCMKHDSHKKINRRVRQVGWGK